MKHLCKILALLAAAGGLLTLMAWLSGRHRRRKQASYLTLYDYEEA